MFFSMPIIFASTSFKELLFMSCQEFISKSILRAKWLNTPNILEAPKIIDVDGWGDACGAVCFHFRFLTPKKRNIFSESSSSCSSLPLSFVSFHFRFVFLSQKKKSRKKETKENHSQRFRSLLIYSSFLMYINFVLFVMPCNAPCFSFSSLVINRE